MMFLPDSRTYTRAEQLADAAIHVVGVLGALLAVPVLVTLAVIWRGDAALVTAVTIYGLTLITMLSFSASYNLAALKLARGRALDRLRRLDHAAIYLKIAGTYTPYAVIAGGAVGKWLLIGVWSGATLGFLGKLLVPHWWQRFSLAFYLGLGWTVVPAFGPISHSISGETMALVAIGGALYTIGVVFYVWEGLPFQNAIWHLFVLVATSVFYAALLVEITAGS